MSTPMDSTMEIISTLIEDLREAGGEQQTRGRAIAKAKRAIDRRTAKAIARTQKVADVHLRDYVDAVAERADVYVECAALRGRISDLGARIDSLVAERDEAQALALELGEAKQHVAEMHLCNEEKDALREDLAIAEGAIVLGREALAVQVECENALRAEVAELKATLSSIEQCASNYAAAVASGAGEAEPGELLRHIAELAALKERTK